MRMRVITLLLVTIIYHQLINSNVTFFILLYLSIDDESYLSIG